MAAVDPERAKKVAEAARAWQKLNVKKRQNMAGFAKKRGIQLKLLKAALKNPRKRLRKAEDRIRFLKFVSNEKAVTEAQRMRHIKLTSTPNLLQQLNLTTLAARTARRDRQHLFADQRALKRRLKMKRIEEARCGCS